MSAFASLVLLIIIAIAAMGVVAYSNYKVEKAKKVRHVLHKHRCRVEELEDVVLALDQICENRAIPRLVNDEIIDIYEHMIELDEQANHLKAGLSTAQARSDELSDESTPRILNRLCSSDAQIARLQAYLNASVTILRKQHNLGKLSVTELQAIILELEWLHLQVSVVSNIAQGHKSYCRNDILTANAFYKKAQTELISADHPDERRHRMISQLADVLFGRRRSLDFDLMPEDEFNPENNVSASEEEEADATSEIPPEMLQQKNKPSRAASTGR